MLSGQKWSRGDLVAMRDVAVLVVLEMLHVVQCDLLFCCCGLAG